MSGMTNGGETSGAGLSASAGARREIAFLGPEGTYGQQAAKQFARDGQVGDQGSLEWVASPTITDAYDRNSLYTVLPLENTIFGPVTETLDCLFTRLNSGSKWRDDDKGKGREKQIVATLDLPIRHCLVVKRGTRMEDIRWVRSHEQALGQSANFLDTHLAYAKRIPTASTALAAQSLLTESELGAALCSSAVVEADDRLEVLHEGTQDRENNFTRFVLLRSTSSPTAGPDFEHHLPCSHFILIRDAQELPALLDANPPPSIMTVHARPHVAGRGRYPSCLFVEILANPQELSERAKDVRAYLGGVNLGSARRYNFVNRVPGNEGSCQASLRPCALKGSGRAPAVALRPDPFVVKATYQPVAQVIETHILVPGYMYEDAR